MQRLLLCGVILAGLLGGGTALAQDWLAICSKCIAPSIISKSGIGTANAVATARISRRDAQDYCQNWMPDAPLEDCIRGQLAAPEAKQTYRASADCIAGRITPIDGKTYREWKAAELEVADIVLGANEEPSSSA